MADVIGTRCTVARSVALARWQHMQMRAVRGLCLPASKRYAPNSIYSSVQCAMLHYFCCCQLGL